MKLFAFLLLFTLWLFNTQKSHPQDQKKSETRQKTGESSGLLQQMDHENLKGIYFFSPETHIDSFFTFCQEAHIDMISTSDQFYENKDFLEQAKENGIAINLNFPVYFDQTYLENHPEHYAIDSRGQKAIHSWLHFACPSHVEFLEHRKKRLKEMFASTQPDMVSFDFIRFFVFWEKVYQGTNLQDIVDGCYCKQYVQQFQAYSGMSVENHSPLWIKKHASAEWANWKCHTITETVRELVAVVNEYDEELPVGLKLVPWKEEDFDGAIRSVAGQDIHQLKKYVDLFIPMTYSHMLKREPEWIHDVANNLHMKTGKPVITSVEIARTYVKEKITDREFKKMVWYGNMEPSGGILLFHYGYLLQTDRDI